MDKTATPNQCAQGLAGLLDAQAEVCRQILEKSKLQQQLVEERREDELLLLLAEKQRLIDKQQTLSAQAMQYRVQWEGSVGAAVGPDARADVERAWNSLREILDQVVKLEDASRAFLEEQKGKVSMDIGNLQRGKIVNKAYGGGGTRPPPTARYRDKQG